MIKLFTAIVLSLVVLTANAGHEKGTILVKFKNPAIEKLSERDYRVKKGQKLYKLHVKDAEKALKSYKQNPNVEFATLNTVEWPVYVPNDPLYGLQWQLPNISSDISWELSTGEGVVVGVCDTGIDTTHPDLQGKVLAEYDAWNNVVGRVDDLHGHGTAVTGTIMANMDNNEGVSSVAPDAKTVHCRLAHDSGGSTTQEVMYRGITWAVDQGADVVNVSYSGVCTPAIREAAQYAWDRGSILVMSAGNSHNYDGCFGLDPENTVIVGATNSNDERAQFSTFGEFVDLVAPGENVYIPMWKGRVESQYGYWSGTSFSSPIVAGVLAQMIAYLPTYTNAQLVQRLLASTDELGDPLYYGEGKVNAYDAIAGNTSIQPDASFTVSGDNIAGNLTIAFSDTSTDPDGTVVGWEWDFGDGSSSTEKSPTRTYVTKGIKTVSLVVTDNLGKRDTETRDVNVGIVAPISNFTVEVNPLKPTEVWITDLAYDNDSPIVLTEYWCGTQAGRSAGFQTSPQNYICRYQDKEDRVIKQQVTDDSGLTDSTEILVTGIGGNYSMPEASSEKEQAGFTVKFRDTSTDPDNDITQINWISYIGTCYGATDCTFTATEPGTQLVMHDVYDSIGLKDREYFWEPLGLDGMAPTTDYTYTVTELVPDQLYQFNFKSEAVDPDGTLIDYGADTHFWIFEYNGITHYYFSPRPVIYVNGNPAEVTLRYKVTDTDGWWNQVRDEITSDDTPPEPPPPPPPPKDEEPPTIPAGVVAKGTGKDIRLNWYPSSDNVGVTGYIIYRNGVELARTRALEYRDPVADKNVYRYNVSAYDAAGNESDKSSSAFAQKKGK